MDFIVVQHGNPDSYFYDSSCDGTWLLMKDIIENAYWASGSSATNEYANSNVHNYINTTFLSYFDQSIQSIIKQVKLPYVQGSSSQSVKFSTNGLSTKVFLLSAKEAGLSNTSYLLDDGLALDYFSGSASSGRIAYKNGVASAWWTRSPRKSNTTQAIAVNASGNLTNQSGSNTSYGLRPAIIIPSGADVSDGVVIG